MATEIIGDPIPRSELVEHTNATRDRIAVILVWTGIVALVTTGVLSIVRLDATPVLGCWAIVSLIWMKILPTYFNDRPWKNTESNST